MATSGKSTKRSGASTGKRTRRKTEPAIDRPFEPAVWKKAAKLAEQFRLIIESNPDLGFMGYTSEMPFVMADGPTIDVCAANTIEATTMAVATMLEQGERPPTPAKDAKRDRQLNIRLTADEKERLEAAAQQAGFRSVSDFLRTAGLDRAG